MKSVMSEYEIFSYQGLGGSSQTPACETMLDASGVNGCRSRLILMFSVGLAFGFGETERIKLCGPV